MTFDKWMKRPVYVIQCRSVSRAKQLMGVTPETQGIAAIDLLHGMRAKKDYRDTGAQILRDMVALSLKMDRASKRVAL